jgi:alkanesulfonate monooxygenase SsuD/methylene tetrahydromethanopterin reductase-like flavin-dependent oxidoreductase (luciferase family)
MYIAASGPRSARATGELGDGWINLGDEVRRPEIREAFRNGARAAGKDPDRLPVLVPLFVVVGGTPEAEEAAQLWRVSKLGPANVLDMADPREIQRLAEERTPLEDVYRDWVVSEDPRAHIEAIHQLSEAGATDIFIQSGQRDQQRVIDFYAREVLPRVRTLQRAA